MSRLLTDMDGASETDDVEVIEDTEVDSVRVTGATGDRGPVVVTMPSVSEVT